MKERVAVVRCRSYEPDEVRRAVARVFALCGAPPESFGAPILLKPNMLSARGPGDGVTTHPAVVEAVGSLLPPGVLIGDSPANAGRPVEEYWNACGYAEAAARIGARMVRFDRAVHVPVRAAGRSENVPTAALAGEAAVVNLPKLKTHGLTVVTGAVKNLYGLIPGYRKSLLHARFVSAADFSSFLAAFYATVRSRLVFTLVDAVDVMEGNGPSAGAVRRLGLLVGGRDALAVDIACARLLGIPPDRLPVVRACGDRLGLPDVEIAGDDVVPLRDFRLPTTARRGTGAVALFAPLLAPFSPFFRIEPEIDPSVCRRCGACRNVCGVAAIGDDLKVDRKKCIKCLCCHEVCPWRAVRLRKSLLARLLT